MAGDWIKFELATLEKPEVCQLASLANVDMDAVVGKLLRVWGWFDQHTEEGNAPSVSKLLLDRLAGVTGFCDFMCQVGWMVEEGGVISLPRFDRHNGKTAKNRLLTAKRVANHKAANAKGNGASVSDALPREDLDVEKSKRKDIEPPLPPEGDAAGAASDRPRPKPRKSTTVTATTMTNSVTGLSQDVAEAYLVHRKAKRAPLTDLAWKGIAKTLLDAAQLGAAPDRVLNKAIERGWTGLELEWLINSGVLSSGHQGSPPHLNLDQIDHEEGLERQADGTYRIARP
ncbi:hypothetical protein [Pseudomonas aeruginosa]|uniref:hypothetical protein n=1 Tax=Pseudomonas aeruginosa TaxID=287 RepID=UPI0021C75C2A|nr:hypothetical protein [Pseudomonas aeruginosa]